LAYATAYFSRRCNPECDNESQNRFRELNVRTLRSGMYDESSEAIPRSVTKDTDHDPSSGSDAGPCGSAFFTRA